MSIDLSIIIVSYNTKDLTLQTVQSIIDSTVGITYEIIVVDNNSQDGTVSAIKDTYGKKVVIIENEKNAGFAVANNIGMKQAKGEFILLLNSDTIVQETSLAHIVQTAKEHPHFGILACQLLNVDGSIQPQGGALPTLLNVALWALWPVQGNPPFVQPYQNHEIPQTEEPVIQQGWVGGTAMCIAQSTYTKIGGLDEGIFMYAEDVDYCMRAAKNNLLVGIVPKSEVVHIGSASGSSDRAKIGEVSGLLYLFSKWHSRGSKMLLQVILALGASLRYLLFGILAGRKSARSLYTSQFFIALHG